MPYCVSVLRFTMHACYIKLRFLRITENVEELYLLSDKEYLEYS